VWKARAAQVLAAGAVVLGGVVVAAPAASADPLQGNGYLCQEAYSGQQYKVRCTRTTSWVGYNAEVVCYPYNTNHQDITRYSGFVEMYSTGVWYGWASVSCPTGYEVGYGDPVLS
jgi:hypothetical protein